MKRRGRNGGFTLVEILVAVFIFSMVMAGLSAIYSTAYRQGYRTLRDMHLKTGGARALREIQAELQTATLIEQPANGAAGSILSGFKNYMATYNPSDPYIRISQSEAVEWFYFCVSGPFSGRCEDGVPTVYHKPMCLWRYSGTGTTVPIPAPANCGDAPGVIVASGLTSDELGNGSFFSRSSADGVDERNQVRVNWVMRIPATNTQPPLAYNADATFNLQFSE